LDSLEGEEKLEAMVDEEGMNPLHHAAGAGSEQCCELLLGPTIGLPVDLRDKCANCSKFNQFDLSFQVWAERHCIWLQCSKGVGMGKRE
jgi:hypothetical protein